MFSGLWYDVGMDDLVPGKLYRVNFLVGVSRRAPLAVWSRYVDSLGVEDGIDKQSQLKEIQARQRVRQMFGSALPRCEGESSEVPETFMLLAVMHRSFEMNTTIVKVLTGDKIGYIHLYGGTELLKLVG